MGLLDGLGAAERELLLFRKEQRQIPAGSVLYKIGDPAEHVFQVVTGTVQVWGRDVEGNDVELGAHRSGEVFGLAALFSDGLARMATVKAAEDTVLLEFTSDGLETLRTKASPGAASRFLLNFLRAVAAQYHSLRERASGVKLKVGHHPDYPLDPEKWTARIGAAVPDGLLGRLFAKTKYAAGEVIVREGAQSDGFFFLKDGSLRVENAAGETEVFHAPAVFGQECSFAGRPQEFTVTAIDAAVVLPFTHKAIDNLIKSDPERAIEVLHSLALLIAFRVLVVEYKR